METSMAGETSQNLSLDQVDFFQHNGYLLVKEAIPIAMVEELRKFTQQQIEDDVGEIIWQDRDNKLPIRLSFLSERGGAYLELIRHPSILDPLESLVGPNIEFTHNRHNHLLYKPPGNKGLVFHRDQQGWSRPAVTVLAYLDDATVENGCLEIVPGSHHRGVYGQMFTNYIPPSPTHSGEDPSKDTLSIEDRQWIEQAVPVLTRAGDVLYMHCCVMHGAPPNVSQTTRRSITLGYHGSDELQPVDHTFTMLVRGERTEAKPGYRYTAPSKP